MCRTLSNKTGHLPMKLALLYFPELVSHLTLRWTYHLPLLPYLQVPTYPSERHFQGALGEIRPPCIPIVHYLFHKIFALMITVHFGLLY